MNIPALIASPEAGEWKVTFANPEAQQILGLPDPCIGRTLSSIPEISDCLSRVQTLKAGQVAELPLSVSHQKRSLIAIALAEGPLALLLTSSGPDSHLTSTTDALRAKAAGASRIQFMAELVGAFIHEINNPLAVIHGRAGVLRTQLKSDAPPAPEKILAAAERIEQATRRISEVIHAFRDFVRDASQETPMSVSVAKVLNEALALCATRFRNHGIEVKEPESIEPQWLVKSRGSELQHLLIHLMLNAYDAVAMLPQKWIAVEVSAKDGNVDISITDSGKGIPVGLRERLYRPFFTTKTGGKNAGLGLYLSDEIAASLGGRLWLDTESPRTRFVLSLPLSG